MCFEHGDPSQLLHHLQQNGVRAGTVAPGTVRLVTHCDVDDAGIERAVAALRSSQSQSHVARAVEGRSSVTAILSKKISAQWQITAHTIWTPAILIFAVAIGVVLWRRRDRFARAAEWHVLLKAALVAALVGGVAGLAFNDGGVITTTPIALFASSTSA